MKIARAKPEDINALCDLAFAIDAIKDGNIPPADGEEEEWERIGSGNLLNIPNFINKKHRIEEIVYDLPETEEYLKETYGITVYQEQVMFLCAEIGRASCRERV